MTCALLQVVPDDSHEPVSELLQEVLVTLSCKSFPVVISTDNAGKDQHTMSDTMHMIRAELIRQERISASTPETVVVQDVWHARQRIVILLNRGHPDYYSALPELRAIFARQVTYNLSVAHWLDLCSQTLYAHIAITNASLSPTSPYLEKCT